MIQTAPILQLEIRGCEIRFHSEFDPILIMTFLDNHSTTGRQRVMMASVMGSALLLAVLAVPIGTAMAHDCPPGGCPDGRMTGGGKLAGDQHVTHGFELYCNIEKGPNNLEVNWKDATGSEHHFHLQSFGYVHCFDDPNIAPKPPVAPFDKLEAFGYGTLDSKEDGKIYLRLTDAGEPGTGDYARFIIQDSEGNVVLDVFGYLNVGNHQAHKDNNKPV